MLELIAGVGVGAPRPTGGGGTFGGAAGGGGDAVFVVTLVTLCVAVSLFAVGSWFRFGRLLRPDCSLDGVLVSDLISPVAAGSDHRADSDGGSGRGAHVLFVAMFVILFLVFSLLGAGLFILGVAYAVGSFDRVLPVLLLGVVAALAVVVVFSVFGLNAIVRVGARAVFALTFPAASVFAPWAVVGSLVGSGAAVGMVLLLAVFSDHLGARCLAGLALAVVFGFLFL